MEDAAMKVAHFTVHATAAQSERWKRAADAEGYASAGSWLADAADAYLKVRARAGRPIPLAWRIGHFPVILENEEEVTMPGFVSSPFGAYRGTSAGRGYAACHRYTLVYIPESRIIATMRTYRQCQGLASELAPLMIRDQATASKVVERHVREIA
jgi:hypothetical protein